jgi:hypothetical protein
MYRYSNSSKQAGIRSDRPLNNDTIARYAPSVLATEAHESRGDRYAFIPTINVLDGLRNEGFQPYEVRQTKVRDAGRREHTKHLVRLRHQSQITYGAEAPALVLLNSHDATSSYQLLAGFFRFVCSNGLIAGDVTNDIRIRHSGDVVGDVIEGSYRVLDNVRALEDRIGAYKSTQLNQVDALEFSRAAAELRWGQDVDVNRERQLLWARRHDDRDLTLWNVYNRVQENLIQGGLPGRSTNGRRTTTRAVTGVAEDVRINRGLWALADNLAASKTAA